MTDDLVAFVRAANGQVTNRMSLELAAALEAATDDVKLRNQELAVLGSDVRDAQREVEVLTSALEAAEAERDDWKRKYEAHVQESPTDTEFYGR